MAKIRKKLSKAEPVVENEVMEEAVEETAEAPVIELSGEVSSERMHKILEHLQEEFDIKNKGFELTGYCDKGSKIEATLTNIDYEIKFTLKMSILTQIK